MADPSVLADAFGGGSPEGLGPDLGMGGDMPPDLGGAEFESLIADAMPDMAPDQVEMLKEAIKALIDERLG
jgi:hypothetical protein